MKYSYLIFDADDTLLDYPTAEAEAFKNTLLHYEINCEKHQIELFQNVCETEWVHAGLDNTNDQQIQDNYHKIYYSFAIHRFRKLKELIDIPIPAEDLSETYFHYFSKANHLLPGAIEVCSHFSKNHQIMIATNGLKQLQYSRLEILKPYISRLFVSEEVGYIKPNPKFFEYILREYNIKDPANCLMIGDSFSSDIIGAQGVHIDTCWINTKNKSLEHSIQPNYTITNLLELKDLL